MTLADVTVEVFFDSGGSVFTLDDPVLGLLDTGGVLGGLGVVGGGDASDITEYVTSISIDRGRSFELEDFYAGTCVIRFENFDGRFFPSELGNSSPYGAENIAPGRLVVVTIAGQTVFSGLVEDWNFDVDDRLASVGTIKAVDAFGLLANAEIDGHTATSQDGGARISAILDRTEVSYTANRDIDTGLETLQADAIPQGAKVLPYLQKIARTEFGRLFAGRDGVLTFRNRHAASGADVAVEFADDDAADTVRFQRVGVLYGSELLYTRVSVTRDGGTVQTSTVDGTDYGTRVLQIDTLHDTDNAAGNMAEFLAGIYSAPAVRFDSLSVVLDDLTEPDRATVTNLDIAKSVSLVYTPNPTQRATTGRANIAQLGGKIGAWLALDPTSNYASPSDWTTWPGRGGTGTHPSLDFLSYPMLRKHYHTESGTFDWSSLDDLNAWGLANGVDIMLRDLSNVDIFYPAWYTDGSADATTAGDIPTISWTNPFNENSYTLLQWWAATSVAGHKLIPYYLAEKEWWDAFRDRYDDGTSAFKWIVPASCCTDWSERGYRGTVGATSIHGNNRTAFEASPTLTEFRDRAAMEANLDHFTGFTYIGVQLQYFPFEKRTAASTWARDQEGDNGLEGLLGGWPANSLSGDVAILGSAGSDNLILGNASWRASDGAAFTSDWTGDDQMYDQLFAVAESDGLEFGVEHELTENLGSPKLAVDEWIDTYQGRSTDYTDLDGVTVPGALPTFVELMPEQWNAFGDHQIAQYAAKLRGSGTSKTFAQTSIIEGVSITTSRDRPTVVSFRLSPLLQESVFTLDDPVLGLLDTGGVLAF